MTIEQGLPKDKNYLRVLAAVDGISTWKSVRIPRRVPETSTFSHIKNWWYHQLWKEKKWGRGKCLNKGWEMLPWTYGVGKLRKTYPRLALHRTHGGGGHPAGIHKTRTLPHVHSWEGASRRHTLWWDCIKTLWTADHATFQTTHSRQWLKLWKIKETNKQT